MKECGAAATKPLYITHHYFRVTSLHARFSSGQGTPCKKVRVYVG